jgi:predicted esterase
MSTAWYTPTSFSPIPVGRSSNPDDQSEAEDDDEFHEQGEDEILESVEYVCGLIDEEVKRGVEVDRIAVGGFSQGCAVSLVLGLTSRYSGKLGGIVGLSGYLPRGKKIKAGRERFNREENKMGVFLAHGTRDMLVPMRVFRDTKARVQRTVGEEVLEAHEYEGMGHVTCGPEFRDMCAFLEKVVPE